MSLKAEAAQTKLNNLVDSIGVPAESRQAVLALVTHAYIMGLSEAVVQQWTTLDVQAALARELAAPLGIKIEGPKQPAAG